MIPTELLRGASKLNSKTGWLYANTPCSVDMDLSLIEAHGNAHISRLVVGLSARYNRNRNAARRANRTVYQSNEGPIERHDLR
jgi:hypothetical protein